MKKSWKTTEFWAMLVTNVMGVLVLLGVIGSEQGEEIGNALKAIAGGIVSIATTLGYMKSRTEVKKARVEALSSWNVPFDKADTPEVTASKQDTVVACMKKLGV
jgi:hypothetical protein